MSSSDKLNIDKERLKEKLEEKLDVSHFDPNTVIRGAQLTLVGGESESESESSSVHDHQKAPS
jgi:hypothetical protein